MTTTLATMHGGLELGEGPFWDAERGRLSWVDIDRGTLFVTDDGECREVVFGDTLGAAIPFAADESRWMLAHGDTLAVAELSGHVEPLWRGPRCCEHGRFNDAACDPEGRLFAGRICTAGTHRGDLLRLNPDGSTDSVIDDVALANGICWSSDGATMYFVDSKRRTVSAYDYELATGTPSVPRVIRQFLGDSEPDGLTIDSNGALWVAMWGGSEVIRLDGDGTALDSLSFDHRFPTCCAFGGPNMDQLFVTFAADAERGIAGFISQLQTDHVGISQPLFGPAAPHGRG